MVTTITPTPVKTQYTPRHFVKGMASRGLAPLILLEACVEIGRTYQAYQRGGFDEGRERITEEIIGALFWFSGVKSFNKLIDHFVGKKILKLPDTNFDVGKDSMHNPLKNYLKKYKISENKIANFKFAKVASSIILANCLVGFLVPKLNQSITNYYRRNRKNPQPAQPQSDFLSIQTNTPRPTMSEFINKNKENQEKQSAAFKGLNGTQTLLTLANHFENDAKYQLLSTDVGIAGGRTIMARNNNERREILIRDLSSIYFYMFNMPNMNRWLNMIEDGRKTRLDPVSAKYATEEMSKLLKANNGKMSVEEFKKQVFGTGSTDFLNNTELKGKFFGKNKDAIKLDDFLSELKKNVSSEDYTRLSNVAKEMSKLQPEIEGVGYLSKSQVESVLKGGRFNSPEFLDNLLEIATREDIPFAKTAASNRKNPLKFIAQAELDGIKDDAVAYINDIIKRAKGGMITEDVLKKASRMNFIKNSINWGTGFVISAAFLSTFIPKIQYWVTKKVTGENSFPGTTDYSQNKTQPQTKA